MGGSRPLPANITGGVATLLASAILLSAQDGDAPRRGVTDPGVITTRQAITPAGVPMIFDGRVYGTTFGATSADVWVLTAHAVLGVNWRQNKVFARYPLEGNPGFQAIAFDGMRDRMLVAARFKDHDPASVKAVAIAPNGGATVFPARLGNVPAGAIAESSDGSTLVIPIVSENRVVVLDAQSGHVRGSAPTGIAPFGVAVNHDGTAAYVTNWGGRRAVSSDKTAPTGFDPAADRVVVDEKGIAATGSLTLIDLKEMRAIRQITVGLHPTALVWNEKDGRLYVANSNTDSVSVVDTRTNTVTRTIAIAPFGPAAGGTAPSAMALSPGGRKLFVACGGINAVAQIDAASGRIEGYIPTAWYPNAVAVSGDGKYLSVGSLLGPGSGWRDAPAKRFVHSYRGAIAVLPVPDEAQLTNYSAAVAENNRLAMAAEFPAASRIRAGIPARAVPERPGEPSLIDHVVFIIKENRTYDQVFGDVAEGNGDPSLVMFGEHVTPNQHRLARQFVLFDNFYATGGNSADGHQWLTQANETSYALLQGYEGRSYPFDGSDPIAPAKTGFLWDLAMSRGKTVRVYGEYAGIMDNSKLAPRSDLLARWKRGDDFAHEWHVTAPIQPLNAILAANYPSYSTVIPDVIRARLLAQDIRSWEHSGQMPNLVIAALPSDHTAGTNPKFTTPKAMVADNDLAVGQIVEMLSHTPFWKRMAIFIVEDDAQNGVDHVDGHRTVALVASPYARRGAVDSSFYSHQSILKTIELMLGLPTLSLFDRIANDMRAAFEDTPDLSAYDSVPASQSLFESNPAISQLRGRARSAAVASSRMRWDLPDAVPSEKLNRILWGQERGWSIPYPAPRKGVFAPFDLGESEEDEHSRR
jgi:YVTN family beta-propeller protein